MAFALHSNPGAYAVLVGSACPWVPASPQAGRVVLDLISKVARVLGEDPGDDVSSRYQERFGEEPDYSKLLDTLAKSPAERRALLRSYFEPTAEERTRGVKVPGAAHTALAELAAPSLAKKNFRPSANEWDSEDAREIYANQFLQPGWEKSLGEGNMEGAIKHSAKKEPSPSR